MTLALNVVVAAAAALIAVGLFRAVGRRRTRRHDPPITAIERQAADDLATCWALWPDAASLVPEDWQ